MRLTLTISVLLLECITVAVGFFARSNICHRYPDVPCDDGWSRIDVNRCVKYINTSKTFPEAQEHCRTLNGDLVSLHCEDEMFTVICLTRRVDSGHQSIWIGAKRSGTKTENIDGSEYNIPRRFYGSRNYDGKEACVKLNVKHWGSFNDVRCSKKKRFVCAKNVLMSTADPEPPALQPSAVPDGPQPSPVPV